MTSLIARLLAWRERNIEKHYQPADQGFIKGRAWR